MNRDKMENFLEDLSAITKKHGIAIGSLGENSPFLFFPFYASKEDSYRCDKDGNNLVYSGDTIEDRAKLKSEKKEAKAKVVRIPRNKGREVIINKAQGQN